MFFSDAESQDIKQDCDDFLQHYTALAAHAEAENTLCFHVVPKFHFMHHILHDSVLNPRLFWSYGGEDFVGAIAKIARMCTKNNSRIQLPRVVIERWLYGWAAKLADCNRRIHKTFAG